MVEVRSKFDLDDERVVVPVDVAIETATGILEHSGCRPARARSIAEHLCDASLCGVESHGLMRLIQYVEQFESGYMHPGSEPELKRNERGVVWIDGHGGHGIPAMNLAVEVACAEASGRGASVLAIRNVGHTGRLGAFTESVADRGHLCIVLGGGNRSAWRQVAPHGGRKAMLPTNPYSIALPGGERGPVVLDFATARIAGGWIYAARDAGGRLPDDVLMDADGCATTDPEDYFRGGAILPAAGAKGYALALVAEVMAEAMLGPATTEANWLMITVDTSRYQQAPVMRCIAEEILSELRSCPAMPGFERVEIPGEREREHRERARRSGVAVPRETWSKLLGLARRQADGKSPAGGRNISGAPDGRMMDR